MASPAHVVTLCAALGAVCACGGSSGEDDLTVRIDDVSPSCGSSAGTTQLTVTGNLPEKPLVSVVDPNGNPVRIAYRAWMGTSELTDVKWVDRQTLTAVVPPMAAGTYPLVLQGPLGGPVTKEGAFQASDAPCPLETAALVATLRISPATVAGNRNDTVTASMIVRNTGGATATGVMASIVSAPAGVTPGTAPASQDVPGGESRTFNWIYTIGASAGGTFSASARGNDANSQQVVNAPQVDSSALVVTYTVGATVTGLTGTGLVLRNGDDSLAVSTNATVGFPTAVASGASYQVTVGQQPTGQTCTVSSGTGTIGTANVTASVSCAANTYGLSTTVSPDRAGSLACDGDDCKTRYRYSTTPITITATPADGYSFSGWSGDCSGTETCTVTMTADRSVTANFTSP